MTAITINRTLLPAKAHYVLFWGGLAGVVPFLMTILQNNGVSATIIGIIYAVLPFVRMIVKPLFGGVADKFQLHRTVFLGSKIIMTSALFIMYFIPAPSADTLSSQNINATNINNCIDEFELCRLNNITSPDNAPLIDVGYDDLSVITSLQFILMCICMVIGWMGMAVAENTGDVIVLDLLDEQKRGFGNERVWGSISWGLMAMVAGFLIDHASRRKGSPDFSPGFFILGAVGLIDVFVSTRVKVKKSSKSIGILKKVGSVFRRPETIIFTVQVFVIGCLTGVVWTFLIVYLNTLGASQLLIGLTMASQCFLGEIPVFFFADWFLDRIGHANAITLTLAVYALRFALYFCIVNPWAVLAIEITQGVNYGLFFTALATYSSLIAPPGTEATVQGIEQAIFEGFGVGVGTLIAGFLFDAVGGAHMFLYFGIMAAICTLIGLSTRLCFPVVAPTTMMSEKISTLCKNKEVGTIGERQSMAINSTTQNC